MENVQATHICLDAFDGIRGISSVFVVVGHVLTFWVPNIGVSDGKPKSDWPAFGLEFLTAVSLFFVISGFTLITVYDRPVTDTSPAALSTWPDKKDFFWKRTARLAPVYYLGLIIAIAPLICYTSSDFIAVSIPVALVMFQSLALVGFFWNGPLWTVGAFVLCYLCFPSALARTRNKSTRWLWWGIGWMTLISWTITAILSAVGLFDVLHVFGPLRVPQFLVGVFAGLIAKRSPPPRPTLTAELCTAILLANLIVCAALGTHNNKYLIPHQHIAEFALLPVIALWILALAHPDCRGPTRAVLCTLPFRFLGDISYCLYCLHFPVISWCAWAVAGRGVSAAAVPSLDIFYFFCFPVWAVIPLLAVCVLVATLAFYLVEEPARRWMTGRKKGRQQAARPSAAAATGTAAAGATVEPGGGGDGSVVLDVTVKQTATPTAEVVAPAFPSVKVDG
jgi:peptidoglycan/LPS O-acetylase OafA/YrhL